MINLNLILKLLKLRNLSKKKLCENANISKTTLNKILSENINVNFITLARICLVLEVNIKYIFDDCI